jgi:ATP-dependent Lhr-like helicase
VAGVSGLDEALEYHLVNSLGWPTLRPLQRDAVKPVRSGADCVLLAPTAGGKTEAATLPLLSEMAEQNWQGLSVLYVTPLRALLNNLYPRVERYAGWLGRTVGLWHGDVNQAVRRRMRAEPPDILLTTPESLEAMLVSGATENRTFFSGVRAVVIDELHAFAGSDRGWHLLAVLERLQRIAARDVQRIGLSATVGNPSDVATWMQGSGAALREVQVIAEQPAPGAPEPEVLLDFVGSVSNAARVVAALYRGEKRLVFCESRRTAEEVAYELREMGVQTFVSHSSLAAEERRLSEQAFAEAHDVVIVATSTLELGVDIGDLDRVIQIDAPRSVASFLQRLGRTGRRPETVRNALFLATSSDTFLEAAGLLLLWRRGYVEPVLPPPHPRHLAAQQLLALALQEGAYGASTWRDWWGSLSLMDDGEEVLAYLRGAGFLVDDGGLLMVGPATEKAFGRRHFMDLLSSFTAEKELRVLHGNRELGFISPLALPRGVTDPGDRTERKPILINGRAWWVEAVDWKAFEVVVTPVGEKGDVKWHSDPIAYSFEMMRAQREVLLGTDPNVPLSRRAEERLVAVREEHRQAVAQGSLVIELRGHDVIWWTWAGLRANETLRAALGGPEGKSDNRNLVLRGASSIRGLRDEDLDGVVPYVPVEMVETLKFSAALPPEMAVRTLAERFADRSGARATVAGTDSARRRTMEPGGA